MQGKYVFNWVSRYKLFHVKDVYYEKMLHWNLAVWSVVVEADKIFWAMIWLLLVGYSIMTDISTNNALSVQEMYDAKLLSKQLLFSQILLQFCSLSLPKMLLLPMS